MDFVVSTIKLRKAYNRKSLDSDEYAFFQWCLSEHYESDRVDFASSLDEWNRNHTPGLKKTRHLEELFAQYITP